MPWEKGSGDPQAIFSAFCGSISMSDERTPSPRGEARGLLALVRSGQQDVDAVRKLIGNGSPFRRKVRLRFDSLVARLPVKGNGLNQRFKNKLVSAALKKEVEAQLRSGRSQERIRSTINVGPGLILNISKEIRASYLKVGRGRRLSPQLKADIRAAIQAAKSPAEIVRTLQVSEKTVRKFRHALGDFENRRFRRKLSAEQIAEATRELQGGQKWRVVAAQFNVSPTTLGHAVPFRKKHGRDHFALTAEQTQNLRQALKAESRCCSVSLTVRFDDGGNAMKGSDDQL